MGLIDLVTDAFRFKETVFYKETSDLKDRYNALKNISPKIKVGGAGFAHGYDNFHY